MAAAEAVNQPAVKKQKKQERQKGAIQEAAA